MTYEDGGSRLGGGHRRRVGQTPLECAVRIARPEEGDEPARQEPGGSGVGHEDVRDVAQPERTASPQDRLGPAIVTLRDEAGDQAVASERPVQAGASGRLDLTTPAGTSSVQPVRARAISRTSASL